MKTAPMFFVSGLCLMLASCGLINSVAQIPLGILKTAGRTVGVSNLTDAPAQPYGEAEKKEEEVSAE